MRTKMMNEMTWIEVKEAVDAFTKPTNNRSMLYFCEMMDCIQGMEWASRVSADLGAYKKR